MSRDGHDLEELGIEKWFEKSQERESFCQQHQWIREGTVTTFLLVPPWKNHVLHYFSTILDLSSNSLLWLQPKCKQTLHFFYNEYSEARGTKHYFICFMLNFVAYDGSIYILIVNINTGRFVSLLDLRILNVRNVRNMDRNVFDCRRTYYLHVHYYCFSHFFVHLINIYMYFLCAKWHMDELNKNVSDMFKFGAQAPSKADNPPLWVTKLFVVFTTPIFILSSSKNVIQVMNWLISLSGYGFCSSSKSYKICGAIDIRVRGCVTKVTKLPILKQFMICQRNSRLYSCEVIDLRVRGCVTKQAKLPMPFTKISSALVLGHQNILKIAVIHPQTPK